MKTVFVYGTLKEGHRLNPYLKNATLLGKRSIMGYTLYAHKAMYPLAIEKEDGMITGEVYLIEDDMFDIIDRIEQNAGYRAELIEGMIVFIFNYPEDIKEDNLIEVGEDWTLDMEECASYLQLRRLLCQ